MEIKVLKKKNSIFLFYKTLMLFLLAQGVKHTLGAYLETVSN
jgi:hypothetical protein